jgi:hypothetical protein
MNPAAAAMEILKDSSSFIIVKRTVDLANFNPQLCGVMGVTEEESRPCPIYHLLYRNIHLVGRHFSVYQGSVHSIGHQGTKNFTYRSGSNHQELSAIRFISRGIVIDLSYAIRCWASSEDEWPKYPKY